MTNKINQLKTVVLSVCSWFFGTLFLIAGIGGLFDDSILTGLLMLLGGLILLPPIKSRIIILNSGFTKSRLSTIATVLICISAFTLNTDTGEPQLSETHSDTTYVVIAGSIIALMMFFHLFKKYSLNAEMKRKTEALSILTRQIGEKRSQVARLESKIETSEKKLSRINKDINTANEFLKKN